MSLPFTHLPVLFTPNVLLGGELVTDYIYETKVLIRLWRSGLVISKCPMHRGPPRLQYN